MRRVPSFDAAKERISSQPSKTRSRLARNTWTERFPTSEALLIMFADLSASATLSADAIRISADVGDTRQQSSFVKEPMAELLNAGAKDKLPLLVVFIDNGRATNTFTEDVTTT